jgi:hypothetical protein
MRELRLTRNTSACSVGSPKTETVALIAAAFTACIAVLNFATQSCEKILCDCRSMGLRALCNDSPRTPPGPEGSNGNGSVSCAAEHPKFLLSPLRKRTWYLPYNGAPVNEL